LLLLVYHELGSKNW